MIIKTYLNVSIGVPLIKPIHDLQISIFVSAERTLLPPTSIDSSFPSSLLTSRISTVWPVPPNLQKYWLKQPKQAKDKKKLWVDDRWLI